MRKLILHMGISIDGFVATPNGAHDWGYKGEDEAAKRWKLDSLWNAGAHLMGRVTYKTWPPFGRARAATSRADERDPKGRLLQDP
jgi:dihydrofolate reductase